MTRKRKRRKKIIHELTVLSRRLPSSGGETCRRSSVRSGNRRFYAQCGRRGQPGYAHDFGQLAWRAAGRRGVSVAGGCTSLG